MLLLILPGVLLILIAVIFINQDAVPLNEDGVEITPGSGISMTGKRAFASIKGLSVKEKINDKISFGIEAKKAYVRNTKFGFFRIATGKVTEMEDVEISFYDDGSEQVSIKSNYAEMNMLTKNIFFKGDVICTTPSGRTLNAEELSWDRGNRVLRTESGYVYTAENGSVKTGKGIVSDRSLNVIKFGIDRTKTAKRRM